MFAENGAVCLFRRIPQENGAQCRISSCRWLLRRGFAILKRKPPLQQGVPMGRKDEAMQTERAERILQKLQTRGIRQMLITDRTAIAYLTGVSYHAGERFYGLLLRAAGEPVFFLNRLFSVPQVAGVTEVWYDDTADSMALVAEYLERDAVFGVDKDMRARFLLPLMERHAAAGFLNGSFAVDEARGVKDAAEQEKMRRSSAINDRAMAAFRGLIRAGVTEKEIAAQMLDIYRALGAEAFSFEPLVAFGANAADPHHSPDDTPLRVGDAVLFDVGCKKDGYCSDMTRTFFYGALSETHRELYETVRRANEAAIAKVRAGVPLCELDRAAREVIAEKGYGAYFTHRLGHFIGLAEHEAGDVSASNPTLAEAGMIFSIEPGIYLTGEIGVRIEDLVLVTETGCEVLNRYSKAVDVIEA